MLKKKSLAIISMMLIFAISSFTTSAQVAAFNGDLAEGDLVSGHELCATNGDDYTQVFGPIQVTDTTDFTLNALIDGSSKDGNWYLVMLSTSNDFVLGDYLMFASSYGESDTIELDAEQNYYLHIIGCSYLEQQQYPMAFAVELNGDADIVYNGITQVASADD